MKEVLVARHVHGYITQAKETQALRPGRDRYLRQRLRSRRLTNGLIIDTTLRPRLQVLAQQTVSNQISMLSGVHVTDGALVSIDTHPEGRWNPQVVGAGAPTTCATAREWTAALSETADG